MTEKNTVKKEQVKVIFQMIDCKILISRSGLARQVLTIKPDVKFVIKMLKLSNMGSKGNYSCFRKCGWQEKSSLVQPQIYCF